MSGKFLMGNLHLDHIKPLSTAKTEEELRQLCHYTNLQWIWADVNMAKSDTWSPEDEKFWVENIYQNPDFMNLYVPDSVWSAILSS